MEDWTCLGQHKRQPEFPVVTREARRNSRKTTWLPRHRKMKRFPATAPQEKSHVRNWRSKGHLARLMRPTKFPEIPVSLERNTEVFRQDRKSTRLNSSHHSISYAVFCLKKKKKKHFYEERDGGRAGWRAEGDTEEDG